MRAWAIVRFYSLKLFSEFQLEAVNDKIQELKGRWTAEEMPKVSLRASDDVVYEDLIFVLDLLFNSKWTNVSVGGL